MLEEKINNDIKESLLRQETERLEALRLIKSTIQVEKAKDGNPFLPDDRVIKVIQKMVSQSTESTIQYNSGGRSDLADHENLLITVYKTYLPEQMSEEEITKKVKEIIIETGATSIRDMGKVMGEATKFFAGRADNKTVGLIVKTLLS